MNYTVKYKQPNQFFWRTIKQVKGDGLLEHGKARFFVLEDETRVEIPITAQFKFSKGRFYSIKKEMETQAGQAIVTK